jgi:DNA polymerase III delta prime subunit
MTENLFINKYQPLYFSDFGEDNKIIEMLKTLIRIDDLNVLLIGNMTTGKTTILNALVREYYTGFSPKEYETNVLYINSLKEQGINYYRTDVKTFCQTCSTIFGKKKFVVLDDIDFINKLSQQVFRNYIDKFSHNVHFIVSCSNNQKVIESIQSRLTILKIEPLQKYQLMKIINNIKTIENIDIDEDAQNFIYTISNNTIKIIINYMEKFKLLNQHITLPLAIQMCTNISFNVFEEYTNCILRGELVKAIQTITKLYEQGYSVMDILDNYFTFVKLTPILSETNKYNIIPFLCKYITIFHNIHEDEIELALFTNNIFQIVE